MVPEQFFLGRLTGVGAVQSFTGKILRRFTVEMSGEWSEEHRALHLDETYTYIGRDDVFQRSWAIHTDEQGFILGHDALQAARMRGRQRGQDFRIVFDRPRHPGGPMEPPHIIDFVEITQTTAMMIGRISMFGFPLARVHAALTRQA